MDLGSSWKLHFLYVNIYIYIASFFISEDLAHTLNLNCVSRERLGVFLKPFNRIDKKMLGWTRWPLWFTAQSNHEANLRLLLWDLFFITFKHLRHAFIPELHQDRCIVYNHQTLALYCASSCLFTQINSKLKSFCSVQTQHFRVFLAVVPATTPWKSDLSCRTTNQEAPNVFYWCTDLKNSYWLSFIPCFICCVGSLAHTQP